MNDSEILFKAVAASESVTEKKKIKEKADPSELG
jgi:hypothetical protein